MSSNNTPRSERLHICLYGRRNSGKSSLVNAFVGQDIALVSDTPGTTTDPVAKAVELGALGPCLITDTAGYDDEGALGESRVARTLKSLEHCDLALLVIESTISMEDLGLEQAWLARLQTRRIPTLVVLTKCELVADCEPLLLRLQQTLSLEHKPLALSSQQGTGLEALIPRLVALRPEDAEPRLITRGLVASGDVVVLVMPQDASAPKGRLILPQVQTLRELLDLGCNIVSCTPEGLQSSLDMLRQPPRLIITDSQAFRQVEPLCPTETMLTSFSILMAGYKGDLPTLIEGARAIEGLRPESRILIAEACSHAPASEDIGRVKIPALLRRRFGEGLQIEVYSGSDYPEDLQKYDLIIHCGGCMLNRQHVLARLEQARSQGVAITNYGICMAYLGGILERVSW